LMCDSAATLDDPGDPGDVDEVPPNVTLNITGMRFTMSRAVTDGRDDTRTGTPFASETAWPDLIRPIHLRSRPTS
jgi:hypothetical protein